MEIKSNLSQLDPYLKKADLEKTAQKTEARSSSSGSVGELLRDGGDKVSFSSSALKDVVAETARSASEIRREKVDAIKTSLASGNYSVDNHSIAAGILRAESELL